MSKKNEIPEVDIVVDEKAGVIREVKPEKTRSKKGHERRVNTGIYVILVLMSVIWLAPFVFLVFQSFRSYALESGGMVDYLLPKHWSLDNYRFLFEGSNFFPWCGKALITCGWRASALVILCPAKRSRDWILRQKRVLALGAAGGARFPGWPRGAGWLCRRTSARSASSLALFWRRAISWPAFYLKQDDRLLRPSPATWREDKHQPRSSPCAWSSWRWI